MSVEVVMPKLSDTMEEGTILKWLKHVGDAVAAGDVLAEVETDKADMELEAAAGGTLQEIKVQEGESAAVGAVIALLDGAASSHPSSETAQRRGPRQAPPRVTAPAAGESHPQAATKATPEARKLANERGLDLTRIRGSGPGGRIVSEDVDRAMRDATPAPRQAPPAEPASRPAAPAETPSRTAPPAGRQELSRMRQSIARRMSEAFRDIPHFYVTAEIDMTEAARLKDALAKSEVFSTPITYTHLVLKATALALRHHPRLNASYQDGAIELKGEINLGMAVAVEDGLMLPILRRADELPLADLAVEAHRLVEHARRGRFASEDVSGGTFTVSNMGMLDLEEFAAVINPPQAAILAVGAVKERAVARDGAIVARRTMRVTVSCDHRIIDGVVAGRFLEELKRLLENPIVLVVTG